MELFLTDLELLLLGWQLEGPNVPGAWVLLVFLAVLVFGYMAMRFLLLSTKWSAVLQLFSQANIIIPSDRGWWVLAFVLGALIIGAIWWLLSH